MLLQIGQNWHFPHRIKQLKAYSIMFIQKIMIAALDLLLLVTKSSHWGTKTNKTEIRNLKVESWNLWCLNLCVVLNFDITKFYYF